MNESGKRKAESGGCAVKAESGKRKADEAFRPRSAFRPRLSAFPPAVTLIELLITMAIMAIISAAILGTASAAMEGARRSRTQTLVTKIHGLVTEHLASYETRRLDVHSDITKALDAFVAAAGTPAEFAARNIARGQMLADARLLAIRELIKKEMPDRRADIEHVPLVLSGPPPLAQTYFRRYGSTQAAENDAEECLYMTVMAATGDGEARTLFAKQDIGDIDDDGAPEFHDGWGQPIGWIRWPAGVVSDLQPLDPPDPPSKPDFTRVDHDPLDPYRRDLPPVAPAVMMPPIGSYPDAFSDSRNFQEIYKANIRDRIEGVRSSEPARMAAFRLVPLIYSAGPDGDSGMRIPSDEVANQGIFVAPLDPYLFAGFQAGEPDPGKPNATKDNITSHLNEY